MANALQLLLTEAEFRLHVPADEVKWDKLYRHVAVAQQDYLPKLLGSALYHELLIKYSVTSVSGEALEPLALAQLREGYIAPLLAWAGYAKAIPFLHTVIRNAGVGQMTAQGFTAADGRLVADLKRAAEGAADLKEAALLAILRVNRHQFPNWTDPGRGTGNSAALHIV